MRAVTVTLLLDVDDEAAACDAMNEILREQQRHWVETSCLIDYALEGNPIDAGPLPGDYIEGDFFVNRARALDLLGALGRGEADEDNMLDALRFLGEAS